MDRSNIMRDFADANNPVAALKRLLDPTDINLKTRVSAKQIKRMVQIAFLEKSGPVLTENGWRYPDPLPILLAEIEIAKQLFASYKGERAGQIVKGTEGTHVEHRDETKKESGGQ